MHRKQNFYLVFGLAFHLPLPLLHSSIPFLTSPFLSFTGYLLGFISLQNDSGKAFRITGLNGRYCRWVVEQDFHWHFWVQLPWSFILYCWSPGLKHAHCTCAFIKPLAVRLTCFTASLRTCTSTTLNSTYSFKQ